MKKKRKVHAKTQRTKEDVFLLKKEVAVFLCGFA
jgi:hypothetical protein